MKNFKIYFMMIAMVASVAFLASCGDDDAPEEENVVEVFTDVMLIFTPEGGGTPVTASAQDPDGAGAQELMVQGAINLAANTTYTLTFEVLNALDPNDVEDITEEIAEEDNEHQFFFGFTTDAFSSPMGSGNIGAGNQNNSVNYNDMDENGCRVGLNTSWTTGDASSGTFTVQLQHQPDVKTCTTGSDTGDTDFDLTFTLNIQ